MKRNQFYKNIKTIILLIYLANLNIGMHTPKDEENYKLTIPRKQYVIGNSIQVGIFSCTIMAFLKKKNKKQSVFIRLKEWAEE